MYFMFIFYICVFFVFLPFLAFELLKEHRLPTAPVHDTTLHDLECSFAQICLVSLQEHVVKNTCLHVVAYLFCSVMVLFCGNF